VPERARPFVFEAWWGDLCDPAALFRGASSEILGGRFLANFFGGNRWKINGKGGSPGLVAVLIFFAKPAFFDTAGA